MTMSTSDARKRRQPEVEYDPAVLQSELDWMKTVAEAAMTNHRKADKGRVEALDQIDRLTQVMFDGWAALGFDTDCDDVPGPMIAGAGSIDEWCKWWLRDIHQHVKDSEIGEDELHARIAHLERSMRAVVLMLQDEKPTSDVIQTISDALEVRHG